MKNLCLVVVCMLGFACSSEGKSEKPEIYQQWSDGKAIVVIVDANEDSDSEHYADWSTTSTNSPTGRTGIRVSQAGGTSWRKSRQFGKIEGAALLNTFF